VALVEELLLLRCPAPITIIISPPHGRWSPHHVFIMEKFEDEDEDEIPYVSIKVLNVGCRKNSISQWLDN
jgi:hypothetical protein